MASWLSDASANRHIKTYVKDFLDLSGNLTVRSNEDYDWNAYGQVLSGNYESDGAVSFGISTDMDASGTTIVVGANKDNTAGTAGAAYVYKYDSDAEIWYQHGPSLTPNTSVDSRFGWQAAFISDDGSIVAVHDHLSSSTTSSNTAVGKTYVFQYNSSTNAWDDYGLNQSVLEGTSTNEQLGHTGLSMSGDGSTIAAAEELNDHEIRIFKLVSGSWTQIGTFSTSSVNYARPSLNYDGSRVVFNDYTNQQALVYDYSGSGTSWNQVGSAITNTGANGTDSHTSINKEGNIVAIHEQTNQTVRIYQYDTNVTGSWKQLGTTLMNSYGSSGAFGKMRLNTAGDMIIVGDSGNSTLDIFKYQNDDWVIIGDTITGIAGSQYGRAVAISDDGSKIVVGGYAADLNTTDSGYVQAFQWSQKTYTNPALDISGGTMTVWGSAEDVAANYSVTNVTTFEDGTDNYGANMKFNADGTIMVVGEWGYNSNAGRIHAYKYRSGTWSKMGSDAVDSNIIEIGFSLGINDSGFIIGSGGGGTSGGVIIWEFINGDWSVKGGEISNSNFSYFGHRGVSFNGEGNIVACKGNEGAAVYQYNSVNDNWDQLGSDITGINTDADRTSIALNQEGNIVAIGDSKYDSPATDAGRVGIFQYNSGTTSWVQLGDWITAPSTTSGGNGDHYGISVSLSSDGYIVAFGTAIGAGDTPDYHARIFQYVPSVDQWTPRSPDVQNDNVIAAVSTGGKVGNHIALSGDGNTLVVNDQDAQTASGVYGGAVHVLKYINGVYKWVTRLDGPSGTSVYLGANGVAISRDGTRFGGSREGSDYVRIGTIVNSPPLKIEDGNTIMNGNVGIGTTSPTTKLDVIDDGPVLFASSTSVHSSIKSTAGAKIILNNRTLSENSPSTDETKSHGKIIWAGHNRSLPSASIEGKSDGWDDAGELIFATSSGSGGAVERMRIADNGNVGIGTDNPQHNLSIYNTTPSLQLINTSSGSTGNDGMVLEQYGLSTYFKNNENGNIFFRTQNNNTRLFIQENGNIGIGNTSPSYKLEISGTAQVSAGLYLQHNSGSYTQMYINTAASGGYARLYLRNYSNENKVTIYANASSFSDDRLKTDEEFVTGATDTLMKLSVQKYKKYENFDLSGSFQEETGLIAQDIWYNAPELRHIVDLGVDASGNKVQPLPLPDGVDTLQDIQDDPDYNALGWGDEQAGVLYAQLIPYLIKSNQEQQEEINTLKTQLTDVLSRLAALESA